MPIKYYEALDIKILIEEILNVLELSYIDPHFVYCIRSTGSKSKYILARIHGLGRIWQQVLRFPPAYIIEIISERYDKLTKEEQEKIIIHELLHIPKGFSGGFRPHKGIINRKTVECLYNTLQQRRKLSQKKASLHNLNDMKPSG
jgi:predicted metallopeptidase